MSLPDIHRVVTGHDAQGNSVVTMNGPLSTRVELEAIPGTVFHEVWSTDVSPALINNASDPTTGQLILSPPANGTRIRFVDIPPDTDQFLQNGESEMKQAFSQIGEASASTTHSDSPHPLMHQTETIDYGILIEGELTLILDHGEVDLYPGSVVIQRGTNHAWANRSGKMCRILFILIDAQYDSSIQQKA